MINASNLPPGCSSPDGGIDHDFEAAIESLIAKIPDARTAEMLENFIDSIDATYAAGYADGQRDNDH